MLIFHRVNQFAWRFRSNRQVALKVIKNIEKYRDAAFLEINVLKKLTEKDPDGR